MEKGAGVAGEAGEAGAAKTGGAVCCVVTRCLGVCPDLGFGFGV